MKHYLSTGAMALALMACGQSPQQSSTVQGYVIDPAKVWSSNIINVCWENGTKATADFQKKVEHAVVGSYNLMTNVQFVGWGPCRSSGGLHIEIYGGAKVSYTRPVTAHPGHPRVFGLGSDLEGKRPGMLLNPSLKNVNPKLKEAIKGYSKGQLENLQFSIALHEFGHAVGLVHEQARPDSNCVDYIDSRYGHGFEVGVDDPASIMNYCLTHVSKYENPLFLSDGDLESINALYP